LEFILPEEMFGEEFDRWPQYHDDIKSTPLGLIYPVVLRSRWRLRDPRAARHWADWEHWWDVLTTIGCSQMHWIGTPRDIRPDALYASLANGTPCGVGFGFAPRAKTALDLFGRALRAGAPILVWSRKTGASEAVARSELNSLVAGDVRTLPHRLLKRRRDAASKQGDDFGHNIAVIWDDSDRNPERMSNPLTARSLISS
jgi:hypothetical protein